MLEAIKALTEYCRQRDPKLATLYRIEFLPVSDFSKTLLLIFIFGQDGIFFARGILDNEEDLELTEQMATSLAKKAIKQFEAGDRVDPSDYGLDCQGRTK